MNTHISLEQQAIQAAKQQNWQLAVDTNQQLVELDSADLGALNRLGVAYLQLGDTKAARQAFQKVLDLDKSNTIAKKHLARLKNNQGVGSPSFHQVYFIEEPGKTKIVELHRLAGKPVLEKLGIGQRCELKPKNRYVSVETDGIYIGALPEDISFRLTKLMTSGNQYDCFIHSMGPNNCGVYIRESFRSPKNQDMHSFPIVKNNLAAINDLDQGLLFEEDIPVQVADQDIETDAEPDREQDTDRPFYEREFEEDSRDEQS